MTPGSKSGKAPNCVICNISLENPETNTFECPRCKRTYILDYEILSYPEEFGTAHDNEAAIIELEGVGAVGSPKMATKSAEEEESSDNNDYGYLSQTNESILTREKNNKNLKSDIKIPKYLKNSDTTKVIEFEEE